MMRGGRIGFALVSLVLVAGVVSYYWWPLPLSQLSDQAGKGKGKGGKGFGFRAARGNQTDIVPVLAVDARTADVPVYLDGVGTAKALNTVTVSSQVDGKIISIPFTEGQDVPKGFVLAKVDPTVYQAQFDQAVAKKAQDEAQLANARLDLERYTKLAQTNAVNKQQLDTQRALVAQLEAQVQYDQAAIDNARQILSYTDIVAPIAGRTGIRMVDAGNILQASQASAIVVLTEIRPISVFFSLPQQNLPKLTKALAAGKLPIDALGPDGTPVNSGEVTVLDNQVDQTTGTVKLKAVFPNEDLQLWPGQFTNVVVVPTAAVQRGPNGPYVYIVKEDSTVTVRPITVTQQDERQAVIATGLAAGEVAVTSGFARLAEGTPVSVSNPGTPVGQANGAAKGEKRVQALGDTPTTTP
jgi:multidrug efflux system membrane fusion protein